MRTFKNILRIILPMGLIISLAHGITGCSLSGGSVEKLYEASKDDQFDAIIVPGYPYKDSTLDPIMEVRIKWAHYLYQKGIAKNIIFSGSAVYSPYTESEIMKIYAEELGIPKGNVFAETKAEHSTENVYFSSQMAKKLGFKKVALATDPVQSKMIRSFAKKYTPHIVLLPILFDTIRAHPIVMPSSIDPSPAFQENFVSIEERENMWQRMRGTMGKNIDFE